MSRTNMEPHIALAFKMFTEGPFAGSPETLHEDPAIPPPEEAEVTQMSLRFIPNITFKLGVQHYPPKSTLPQM